ncbi:hypothetical protein Lal_00046931 [Lupinus albus]|nr:hypothetical protein Lal_00046931 [Lupinus albus]
MHWGIKLKVSIYTKYLIVAEHTHRPTNISKCYTTQHPQNMHNKKDSKPRAQRLDTALLGVLEHSLGSSSVLESDESSITSMELSMFTSSITPSSSASASASISVDSSSIGSDEELGGSGRVLPIRVEFPSICPNYKQVQE